MRRSHLLLPLPRPKRRMTRRMTRRPASDYRAAMTQPLCPSTVHLWYTQSDDLTAPAALDAYLGLLSPDERTRHARFLNERARHEYLITRALCRTVLSRYAAVAPADWRFRANQWGRPEIDCPSPELRPTFASTCPTPGVSSSAPWHRAARSASMSS